MSLDLKSLDERFYGAAALLVVAVLLFFFAPPKWRKAVLVAWLVGPPVFQYFEYVFNKPCNPVDLESFKYVQGLSAAIWAGVAAAFAAVYFQGD